MPAWNQSMHLQHLELAACEVVDDAFGDLGQGDELVGAEQVDEMSTDGLDVKGRGFLENPHPLPGKRDDAPPAVVRVLLAGNEAALLHPGDVMRQPAARPEHLGREVTELPAVVDLLRE